MKTLDRALLLWVTCLVGLVSSIAYAQESLTPARYFECQISARSATVVGLQERVSLLSGNAGTGERQAAAEMSRTRVTRAFSSCGHSASTLGAYAHRNADELQVWLDGHPSVKARLDAMAERISSLSAQMPAPASER